MLYVQQFYLIQIKYVNVSVYILITTLNAKFSGVTTTAIRRHCRVINNHTLHGDPGNDMSTFLRAYYGL